MIGKELAVFASISRSATSLESAGATEVCDAGAGAAAGVAAAISADFGFSSRSPLDSLRKSTESRSVLAVSRISRIGSSVALRNSCWNPLDIFFSSAYNWPSLRIASGSFSGPSTTRARSRMMISSLPWRLNTRAV